MSAETQLQELIAYLRNQVVPPTTDEEFLTDVEDFLRLKRRRVRQRRRDTKVADDSSVPLPPKLDKRQRDWIAARRRRFDPVAAEARCLLGYASVPFPAQEDLADALWQWMCAPVGEVGTDELSQRLATAVASIQPPPIAIGSPTSNDDAAPSAFGIAVRQFMQSVTHIAEILDLPEPEIARWLLADVPPKILALQRNIRISWYSPTRATLIANPSVVTPEELRSVYRALRKRVSTADQLRVFVHPDSETGKLTGREQLRLWNELHPLFAYKNVASFRVAASRANKNRHVSTETIEAMGTVTRTDEKGVKHTFKTRLSIGPALNTPEAKRSSPPSPSHSSPANRTGKRKARPRER